MKIVSWNIRAGGGKRQAGILAQLIKWQPDVIALGEFRGTPASQAIATGLATAGWPHQLQSTLPKEPATNALLIASRYPLMQLRTRHAPTPRQRWLLARVMSPQPFVLGNMHIPNSTSGYKYQYLAKIHQMIEKWRLGPGLLLGDTNCGKSYIDDATGVFWRKEHEWMEGIEERRWVDAFRYLHGDERVYTWYSHRDNGFRLDQAFLNPAIMPTLVTMRYEWGHNPAQPDRREGLSDHAAILLDLNLTRLK